MDLQEYKPIVEALIFASQSPLTADKIVEVIEDENLKKGDVKEIVDVLNNEYEKEGRAFKIFELAGGYEFRTISEFGDYLRRLYSIKKSFKLSKSALETLSIIAYKQPVTRIEIEMIRNVAAAHIINKLLDLELIKVVGQKDTPGKPLLYGTTSKFLEYFGLNSLSDLPEISEIESMVKE